MPADEVAHLFQDLDLLSAPVVDADRRLLGRITVDDVVDQIRESSDRAMMHMAGLDEEADMFARGHLPVRGVARYGWASTWSQFFRRLGDRAVPDHPGTRRCLAVLMPIVASMGGIVAADAHAGDPRHGPRSGRRQQCTRLAGQGDRGSRRSTACCGRSWWPCWRWLGSATGRSAASSARAILINLLFAALAGLVVPLVLERMGNRPGTGGRGDLTTVTDVIGFFAFSGWLRSCSKGKH